MTAELHQLALLCIPTVFDLVATVLMNVGLLSVTASVYQMMRGAEMLFAALFTLLFLGRELNRKHVLGIVFCVVRLISLRPWRDLSGSASANLQLAATGHTDAARVTSFTDSCTQSSESDQLNKYGCFRSCAAAASAQAHLCVRGTLAARKVMVRCHGVSDGFSMLPRQLVSKSVILSNAFHCQCPTCTWQRVAATMLVKRCCELMFRCRPPHKASCQGCKLPGSILCSHQQQPWSGDGDSSCCAGWHCPGGHVQRSGG